MIPLLTAAWLPYIHAQSLEMARKQDWRQQAMRSRPTTAHAHVGVAALDGGPDSGRDLSVGALPCAETDERLFLTRPGQKARG